MDATQRAELLEKIGTPLMTTSELAGMLAVTQRTVVNWIAGEKIPSTRLPGGDLRIPFFAFSETLEIGGGLDQDQLIANLAGKLIHIRTQQQKNT